MKWKKMNDHVFYTRDNKQKIELTLWALVDEYGNTMHQMYTKLGEIME